MKALASAKVDRGTAAFAPCAHKLGAIQQAEPANANKILKTTMTLKFMGGSLENSHKLIKLENWHFGVGIGIDDAAQVQ
jgi:hypothetical protein